MSSLMSSYYELQHELKCPIHSYKQLDRLVLDQNEQKCLVCSLCEHEMKKQRKDKLLTVPLEAFLQQLSDIENEFTNQVGKILQINQARRNELINACSNLIDSFTNFQNDLKQQIDNQELNIKANLNKARESSKLIVSKILGDYTTKSTFEGLYSSIVNKLKFDKETGDLLSLIEYDNALRQAQINSDKFIDFSNQIAEDINSLFKKFNRNNSQNAKNLLDISKINSARSSFIAEKQRNILFELEKLSNPTSINLTINGSDVNSSQFLQELQTYISSNSQLKECRICLNKGSYDINNLMKFLISALSNINDFQFNCKEINLLQETIQQSISIHNYQLDQSLKQSELQRSMNQQKISMHNSRVQESLKESQFERVKCSQSSLKQSEIENQLNQFQQEKKFQSESINEICNKSFQQKLSNKTEIKLSQLSNEEFIEKNRSCIDYLSKSLVQKNEI